MTTVLLTGFEPFHTAVRNPSWDAVVRIAADWDGDERVEAVCLPVAFARSVVALTTAIGRLQPDVVIAVGLAGRAHITPERVAVNLDDTPGPDADGLQPLGDAIREGGPVAYFSSLPVKRMVVAAQLAGAPAQVSDTAGGYVCNHVFYALQELASSRPQMRSGFVHVPPTPETNEPGHAHPDAVSLDVIIAGLTAAIRAAIDPAPDIKVALPMPH